MDPSEALAEERPARAEAPAPAAAHWLTHPEQPKHAPTQAELWAAEPEWIFTEEPCAPPSAA